MEQSARQTKPLLIDTNIFLESLLKQQRSAESRALLQAVEQGRIEAYMTSFSLHSVEVILDRLQKQATLE
jgi:predicted nucleic acid-binding protein